MHISALCIAILAATTPSSTSLLLGSPICSDGVTAVTILAPFKTEILLAIADETLSYDYRLLGKQAVAVG